jgi:hypothetical protein
MSGWSWMIFGIGDLLAFLLASVLLVLLRAVAHDVTLLLDADEPWACGTLASVGASPKRSGSDSAYRAWRANG